MNKKLEKSKENNITHYLSQSLHDLPFIKKNDNFKNDNFKNENIKILISIDNGIYYIKSEILQSTVLDFFNILEEGQLLDKYFIIDFKKKNLYLKVKNFY